MFKELKLSKSFTTREITEILEKIQFSGLKQIPILLGLLLGLYSF